MSHKSEDGFSLVEVLVAFVLLAGAVILSFQIFSDGVRRIESVETRLRETSVVRGELEKFESTGKLAERTVTGKTDGVDWRITVSPLEDVPDNSGPAFRPFKVEIVVMDPLRGEHVPTALETIILRPVTNP